MARRVDRRVGLDGSVVEVVETPDGLRVLQRSSPDAEPVSFRPAEDPALAGLGVLLDPARCAGFLGGLLGGLLGTPVGVEAAELVRYRASRRATVRLTLSGGPAPVVYAKAFHDTGKAAATARSLAHLVAQLQPDAPLLLPPLLGHDHATGVIVLGSVDGRPVELPSASPTDALVTEFRRIGTAMATLHDLDHTPLPARPTAADLDKTAIRIGRLGDGPVHRRLQRWFERISGSCPPAPPASALVTVHGDCKPAQVLLGPTVAVLDPDHLGVGDPAGDVAQFHVALLQAAARRLTDGDPDLAAEATVTAAALTAAFDAGYGAARRSVDPGLADRVRWFEQLTLLRKAVRAETRRPDGALTGVLADLGDAPA